MESNGKHVSTKEPNSAISWVGGVLSVDDVRRSLNGHAEILLSPRAVVTPLAMEELKLRGIRLVRGKPRPVVESSTAWGIAQESPNDLVASARKTIEREGVHFRDLSVEGSLDPAGWARAVAECIGKGDCRGGVVFCRDGGLTCCIANKLAGLRAIVVRTPAQAGRGSMSFGSNFVVVELPGPTLFEIRQILKTVCSAGTPGCPDRIACTLKELDGHAHR